MKAEAAPTLPQSALLPSRSTAGGLSLSPIGPPSIWPVRGGGVCLDQSRSIRGPNCEGFCSRRTMDMDYSELLQQLESIELACSLIKCDGRLTASQTIGGSQQAI